MSNIYGVDIINSKLPKQNLKQDQKKSNLNKMAEIYSQNILKSNKNEKKKYVKPSPQNSFFNKNGSNLFP